MNDQWKPGDVALVSSWRGTEQFGIRVRPRAVEDPLTWCVLDSSNDTRGLSDDEVTSARPLVVIDPENRGQVERLAQEVNAAIASPERLTSAEIVATALRSLIAVPKPGEPQGLGAVVEDAEGRRWIRAAAAPAPWVDMPHQYGWQYWEAVAAVRVLSEGWSE